ncbi:replication initiator protein A [Lachnobacterium bovis]|uniref:replication initiator protein A n=1 Tax=Lachnobacterium bovis TaxID=140626 RepID=UPI00068E4E26|nr:replication initiator protein A [Lachnobacterium bovis]
MDELQFLTQSTKLTNYSVIPNNLHGGELSSTATILYSKLLNRSNLSITNGKVDEQGRVYINYKFEDLAKEMDKSLSTIKENMMELVDAGLIEKKRMRKGRANMIYIKVPSSSIVGKSPVVGTENRPYKGKKTVSTWG